MSEPAAIPLGFEVGTGEPVSVPLKHLCVCGQTQESGKTTTLEALVARSGLRAVAFVTKRGGRLAQLIAGGFFDTGATGYAAWKELLRLGVYSELKDLAKLGFLTKEKGEGDKESYRAVEGMKVNVREAR